MTIPFGCASRIDDCWSSTREVSRVQIFAEMPGVVRTFRVEIQKVGMPSARAEEKSAIAGAEPADTTTLRSLIANDAPSLRKAGKEPMAV